MKDCKKKHTILSMAYFKLDYFKMYDFVPHSWINECIELSGIADNVGNFSGTSMAHWKLSLTSSGNDLGKIDVEKRGISQEDSLSPLLFL